MSDERSLSVREDSLTPLEEERRHYSDDELSTLYELARTFLEIGQVSKAESLLAGLVAVAPDHATSWFALAYIRTIREQYDEAIFCCRQALRCDPEFSSATLLLSTLLMNTNDFQSAGTLLGEISDRIEARQIQERNLIRFFKLQLQRFEQRNR